MAPLQRFVTVHKDLYSLDLDGYIVVTKDFTQEWTNRFTKSDFILEKVATNTN